MLRINMTATFARVIRGSEIELNIRAASVSLFDIFKCFV